MRFSSSSSESIAETVKTPNTLRSVGMYRRQTAPPRPETAAGNAQLLWEGLPRRSAAIFWRGMAI